VAWADEVEADVAERLDRSAGGPPVLAPPTRSKLSCGAARLGWTRYRSQWKAEIQALAHGGPRWQPKLASRSQSRRRHADCICLFADTIDPSMKNGGWLDAGQLQPRQYAFGNVGFEGLFVLDVEHVDLGA